MLLCPASPRSMAAYHGAAPFHCLVSINAQQASINVSGCHIFFSPHTEEFDSTPLLHTHFHVRLTNIIKHEALLSEWPLYKDEFLPYHSNLVSLTQLIPLDVEEYAVEIVHRNKNFRIIGHQALITQKKPPQWPNMSTWKCFLLFAIEFLILPFVTLENLSRITSNVFFYRSIQLHFGINWGFHL